METYRISARPTRQVARSLGPEPTRYVRHAVAYPLRFPIVDPPPGPVPLPVDYQDATNRQIDLFRSYAATQAAAMAVYQAARPSSVRSWLAVAEATRKHLELRNALVTAFWSLAGRRTSDPTPIIRAVERFDVTRGLRFATFASSVVRNARIAEWQRAQVRSDIDGAGPLQFDPIADCEEIRSVDIADEIEWVTGTVQITDAERVAINCRASGMSLAEMGEHLRLKPRNAQYVLRRAQAKARKAAGGR